MELQSCAPGLVAEAGGLVGAGQKGDARGRGDGDVDAVAVHRVAPHVLVHLDLGARPDARKLDADHLVQVLLTHDLRSSVSVFNEFVLEFFPKLSFVV